MGFTSVTVISIITNDYSCWLTSIL